MASDLTKVCPCRMDLRELLACFEGAPPSMNTIRRAFTAFTMYAFNNVSRMGDFAEALSCRTYSDDASSKINIRPAGVNDPGDTELIPGIVISLGDGLQLERLGIGDTSHESSNMSVRVPAYKGAVNVIFKCRDFDSDISCYMADMLLMFFTAIQESLYETWGWLLDYRPKLQTEPQIKSKEGDTDTKWYESTVQLELGINYSVFTAREAPPLKDFSMDAISSYEEGDQEGENVINVPHDGHWYKHRS